jgi:uncharacterized membrane protein YeiH
VSSVSSTVPLPIDLIAVAVGALQGAIFATDRSDEHDFDVVGGAVLAMVMGLGGGIVRDVLLNVSPVAFETNVYLLTVLVAGGAGLVFGRLVARVSTVVIVLDAAVLGLFAVVGTLKAQQLGLPVLPCIFIGSVSATGGGVARDLLVRRPPELMQRGSLYGLAAVAGTITFLLVDLTGAPFPVSAGVATGVAMGLRLASLRFGWRTPSAKSLVVDPQRLDPRNLNLSPLGMPGWRPGGRNDAAVDSDQDDRRDPRADEGDGERPDPDDDAPSA